MERLKPLKLTTKFLGTYRKSLNIGLNTLNLMIREQAVIKTKVIKLDRLHIYEVCD
jgi:hypothetical protein